MSKIEWQLAQNNALRFGIIGAASGAALLLIWSTIAPLSAAVIAEGTVKSIGNRKIVQHAEGGIVAKIHVKDGDRVAKGQLLITLADERVAANAQSLREAGISNALRAQRLYAETTGLVFRADTTKLSTYASNTDAAQIKEAARQEKEIFDARSRQQNEQSHWLTQQLEQTRLEQSLQIEQIENMNSALKLAQRDLTNNQKLKQEGFVSEARIFELERIVADYRGKVQAIQSQKMQARQREAEILQKLSAQKTDFARAAADELKDVTLKISQIAQDLRPASNAETRQLITSPVVGEIVDMKVHTIGSAIGAREAIMEIVPLDSGLVVEAKINPSDIRDVQNVNRHSGIANVLLTAYRARSTPQVEGTITYVGGDQLSEMRAGVQSAYYIAQISIDPAALAKASTLSAQPLVLTPGMQTEVFVTTQERSAWRYLLDPLIEGARHSMRER